MKKIKINGLTWYRCDHLTNLMRKYYGFRMIGKLLYCTPIKGANKWKKITQHKKNTKKRT